MVTYKQKKMVATQQTQGNSKAFKFGFGAFVKFLEMDDFSTKKRVTRPNIEIWNKKTYMATLFLVG